MLEKTRDSYNTDVVSQTLATAALAGRAEAAQTWQAVRSQRERVIDELSAMGLRCDPSQSNFVLATVPADRAGGASAIYASLKQAGVLVRYFDADRLRDKLRITIGTLEENNALIGALRRIIDQ
jgi:histidinol-phosphate aminotransferase